MKMFLIILLIVLCVILTIYSIYYFVTIPERRRNKELLRRSNLLYREKLNAEITTHKARIAGETARNNIETIANKTNSL